jgi:hypothetical protein
MIDELHDDDLPLQRQLLPLFPLAQLAALFSVLLIVALSGSDHYVTRDDLDGGVFTGSHGFGDLDLAWCSAVVQYDEVLTGE